MDAPYAQIRLYTGRVPSDGLKEGNLFGRLPKDDDARRATITQRVKAGETIATRNFCS